MKRSASADVSIRRASSRHHRSSRYSSTSEGICGLGRMLRALASSAREVISSPVQPSQLVEEIEDENDLIMSRRPSPERGAAGVETMVHETAFEMAAASIRFGVGVTREVGMELVDLGVRTALVVTDPRVARLPPVQ